MRWPILIFTRLSSFQNCIYGVCWEVQHSINCSIVAFGDRDCGENNWLVQTDTKAAKTTRQAKGAT